MVATSQAEPSAKGSAAVSVLVPQVSVTPATVTLGPSGTQAFTATVAGPADTSVTWSIQEAAGGSVSSSGAYTAPASTGFFHLVATSVADATVSGSATITVTSSGGRFMPTGSMRHARGFHTATLLPDGKVLMAGGAYRTNPSIPIPCYGGMPSAELYDPLTGSFTAAGNMAAPRYNHTATLLLSGQVLVTGGIGVITSLPDCDDGGIPPVWNSAELYDPSYGSFEAKGSMTAAREGHTATLLPGGKVLIAGGNDETFVGTKTAEIYDPQAGAFSSTGDMSTRRSSHTATVLANGKVLIAGGIESGDQPFSGTATFKAEIYDPNTLTFSPTGNMTTARAGHTATLLATGLVLIAGGSDLPTAELYDPATGSFLRTGDMGQPRSSQTATLLPNGTVLLAGGGDSTAEIYDSSTGLFTTTGGMETRRVGHTATLLQNGKVLVSGAKQSRSLFLATAELYK
ncbi:MAG TPA: kelch repeat-containing protein [Terriglobales bacterium]|nr:kelch repeat-containing protein [Terriglobales bacterium]